MSSFGGITNSINPMNAPLLAGGPAGWSPQGARSLMGAVGGHLIQSMGQQLGLPQSSIDQAMTAFKGSVGGSGGQASSVDDAIDQLGRQYGASPSEIGDQQRTMQHTLDGVMRDLNMSQDAKEAKACRGKGGSWLQAMASALGAKLDQLADKMVAQSAAIDDGKPSASTDFTVTTQQFSMLMNAATNGIKSVGEAMANTARKS